MQSSYNIKRTSESQSPPKGGKFAKHLSEILKAKYFINSLKSIITPRRIPESVIKSEYVHSGQEQRGPQGICNKSSLVSGLLFTILMITFIEFFIQNIAFTYNQFFDSIGFKALNALFCLVTLLKVWVGLNIFRDDKGFTITKRELIAKNYIQTQLFFDIIAFAAQLLGFFFAVSCLICFVTKIYRILALVRQFQNSFIDNTHKQKIWNLVFLFLSNLFIANFMTAILGNIVRINPHNNWKVKFGISQKSYAEQYSWNFYWCVTTVLTVGFGDISPASYEQALVVSGVELIGGIMYIYNINSISEIINNLSRQQKKLQSQLRVINRFIDSRKLIIQNNLASRIFTNIKTKSIGLDKEIYEEEQNIFNKLEQPIKQQIQVNICQNLILKIIPFCKFSREAIHQVCLICQRKFMNSGESLTAMKRANEDIYFLERGYVNRIFEGEAMGKSLVIEQLKPRQNKLISFGLRSLLGKFTELYTHRIAQGTQVYSINILKLIKVFKKRRSDREKFCQDFDQAVQGKLNLIEFCCHCKIVHKDYCPRIHYVAWTKKSLKKQNAKNERLQKKRERKKRQTLYSIRLQKLQEESKSMREFTLQNLQEIREQDGTIFQVLHSWTNYFKNYDMHSQISRFNKKSKLILNIKHSLHRFKHK